jgi:hypothetical protein
MADQSGRSEVAGRGDRRQDDRRGGDRRALDRRLPVPAWRRPWAYAAYGVAGALLVVLLVTSLGGEDERTETGEVITVKAPPPVDPTTPAAAGAPPQDAYSVGDFERLLAEGERSEGLRVRTELFCGEISPTALRDVDAVNRAVAELADANRRVPAAECRWGSTATAPDFLLLVPPALAERFAAAPQVTQDFVARRRVAVELEWVGRSEALALRNAGVLREIR